MERSWTIEGQLECGCVLSMWETYDGKYHHNQDIVFCSRHAAADHLYRAVEVARQLAGIATDWNLTEVEIDGEMVPTYEVKQWFDAALSLADGEVDDIPVE